MKTTAAQHLSRTQPTEILPTVQSYGEHSSVFLALNDGNSFFTTDDVAGTIVYRPFGNRYWVQFTGAIAAEPDRPRLEAAFIDEAARQRRRILAVQLSRSDAELAVDNGYVANPFGCSYSIDLAQFTLSGRKFVKTRNMITRSRREGVTVTEVDRDRLDTPEFAAQLDQIDAAWLRNKGRHVKEMQFLIGQRGGAVQDHRRLFVAEHAGRAIAYISYAPVYGPQGGWLYDLTRRVPDSPPGVIEHLFADAALRLRDQGAMWMHLGLTPFVGATDEHVLAQGHSRTLAWLLDKIGQRCSALYPARSQLAFKLKWRPHLITPEYVAFPRRIHVRDAWCLARITNSL